MKATKRFSTVALAATLALGMGLAVRATTFVKDVMLIGGSKSETTTLKTTYQNQGWTVIDYDLNKGCGSSSDYIYLLYKTEADTGGNRDYVTGFYLRDGKDPPSSLTYGGRQYHKVAYDGGDWFESHYGDLNSNSSGAYIYLYYTKDTIGGYAVTGITFNATSSGAVPWSGNGSPANLNKGCGADSDDIYMHVSTAAIAYGITYNLGGGTNASGNPATYTVESAAITLVNPTRTGYNFAGWTGSNGNTPQTSVTIAHGSTGNKSYTANWTPVTYNISYNLNSGSLPSNTSNPTTYNIESAAITLNNPTRTGYTFAGWTGSNGNTAQTTVTIPRGSTGNKSYTATWTPVTYYVYFNSNGGSGSMSSQSFTYTVAQNLSANAFTRTGYNFAGWSTSPNGPVVYANGASVSNLANTSGARVDLYAVWSETPWRVLRNQMDRGGTVTLTSDFAMAADERYQLVTNTVTLDLHGHTLTNTGTSQFFVVTEGGNLTLTNSVPTSGALTGGNVGVWIAGGTFTMNGGTISGTAMECVFINYGVFTMNGGAITGNARLGVEVGGGAFTMNGGAIAGNTGYGVYMSSNGSFTMNGGAISNNLDVGVWTDNNCSGDFTMNGGTISGNTSWGVYWQSTGSFTVSGSPVIAGNNPAGAVRNICLESGRIICVNGLSAGASLGVTTEAYPMEGNPVVITSGAAAGANAYFFSDTSQYIVNVAANGEVCIRTPVSWVELQAILAEGGTVTLPNDVRDHAQLGSLRITKAVTLDLNGHTISGASYYHYPLINLAEGGNLTLTNSVAGAGAITGGYQGVYVGRDCTFTMNGGTISGLQAGYSNGGGVRVYYGTFTMNSGVISGNSAGSGGGVDVFYGTFTMNGGTISGNSVTYNGGGVYVDGGAFAMNGGVISNNLGGVYMNSGTMTVSGSPVVAGNANSAGVAVNVYLRGGKTISVGGLSAGASLGVTTEAVPAAFSPVAVATGASAGDVSRFSSDRPGCSPELDGDGVLRLKVPFTWADLQAALDKGGTVTLSDDGVAAAGDASLVITNAVTLDLNGYTLTGVDGDSILFVHGGGSLTLTNGVAGAGAVTGGTLGVVVGRDGAFTMAGGAITNNVGYEGGGVYVGEDGVFTMVGGTISGNSAYSVGGGVYVDDGGAFTMAGGMITGNSAGVTGGGVCLHPNGTMAVSGGAFVSGNVNSAGAASNVYLPDGKVLAVGSLSSAASVGVTTETAPTAYAPVTITSGASAGDEGHFFSDASGVSVDMRGGEVCLWTPLTWASLQAALDAGGTVTLPNDVIAAAGDGSLVVTNAVVLDLTGCTITGNDNDDVICVLAGGSLTLTNSVPETGSITCGDVWVDGGTFTMNGGVIVGCDYAGVFVSYAGSVFIMNGGAITNNGDCGVCVYGGAFTMNGGTVADNVNQGVYVYGAGSFAMNGGVVTKNGAGSGGGVCLEAGCTMSVSGSPVIFGNDNPVDPAYNVWLPDGTAIAVGNLAPGAVIGVTTEVEPSVGSPVTVTSGASAGDSRYFLSDDSAFVTAEKDGEVCVRPTSSPWDALQVELDKGGTVTLADDVVAMSGDNPLTVSGAVVLDLAGHTLDAAGTGIRVIEIRSGGSLVLTNSAATGVLTGGCADCGGGVHVAGGGAFTVFGSLVISGNTNAVGAASNVYLADGAVIGVGGLAAGTSIGVRTETVPVAGSPVTFTSGASAGDRAYFAGDAPGFIVVIANGELCLRPRTPWESLQAALDAGGAVTLSGNVTAGVGDAALSVTASVLLDLNGHTITGNGNTEVVRIGAGGNLTLTNSVPETGAITGGGNSGVYVDDGGMFAMTGGAISGNGGGGVYVMGTFAVSGSPVVSGNTNSVGEANNVYLPSWNTIAVGSLSAGASIGVTTEYEPEVRSPISIASGTSSGDDQFFFSDRSEFVVREVAGELCVTIPPTPWMELQDLLDQGGTVTLTNDYEAGELDWCLTITTAVTLDLAGHTLTGNGDDCVIFVDECGDLTLTNSVPETGAITGGCCGVRVGGNGTFTLTGGAISGNTADDGGGVFVCEYGTFTMNGGAISGNSSYCGGGVYVDEGGAFTMTGGAISGNSADYGGGVYVYEGMMTVSGSPVVSGNTNSVGVASNVYLPSWNTIAVGSLSAGASIGVTTEYEPEARSPISIASGTLSGVNQYFFSDRPEFVVRETAGELCVTIPPTPWMELQDLLDQGGTVTLTNDYEAGELDWCLSITNAVTLDLAGHTLAGNGRDSVICVEEGGSLTLTNSVPETGAITGGGDCGVYVGYDSAFTMNGGAITGNTSSAGGGVYVGDGGAFTMNDGTIAANIATVDGGGVFVDENGVFTMNGGVVSGNTAHDGGGGVYVYNDATFTMTGGAISGNASSEFGGGVMCLASFTMTGGTITGNCSAMGGGVDQEGGLMTVYGSPVVFGNTNSVGAANNVHLPDGNTIAVGGLSEGASLGVIIDDPNVFDTIAVTTGAAAGDSRFFSSDGPEIVVDERNGEVCFTAPRTLWQALQAQLDQGGAVTLTNDLSAQAYDSSLMVTNTILLDLAGHTLTGNGRLPVIWVSEGGALTLTNSVEGLGSITGGYEGVIVENGVFTMNGGAISGNTVSNSGGVCVANGGVFTMNGGTISDNGSTDACGGGVLVYNATFTMNGGAITGNQAGDGGGGVFVDAGTFTMNGGAITGNQGGSSSGGGVYVTESGAFTMEDGAISGNSASSGGGVYVYEDSAFTMNGGEITGNVALGTGDTMVRGGGGASAARGGGVFALGTFEVSGSPVVSGNTNAVGEASNVYLPGGNTIAVNGLSAGASIGVSTEYEPEDGYPVAISADATAGDAAYFFSDDPGCHVEMVNGELCLVAGMDIPAYLVGADEIVIANYAAWAAKYGPDTAGTHRDAFLLNIDPATPIPPGAALLKIVEFRFTATSMYIELASDVTQFEENGTGMLGNGFLAFRSALSLSPDPDDWETVGPFPVVFRNGHAIYSYDDQEINGENSAPLEGEGGVQLEGEIGLEPEDPMPRPSSFFFKAILTDRVNTVVY